MFATNREFFRYYHLIKEKEELHTSKKDEITIIDDGTTIKIEDCGENGILANYSAEKQKNGQRYEVRNGKKSDERTYTNYFPLVCRICLAKNNLKVFDGHENLINVFRNITNIGVSTQDELPKNICSVCIEKLQGISAFIELSKFNNAKLQQIFSTQQDDIPLERSDGTAEVGGINTEEDLTITCRTLGCLKEITNNGDTFTTERDRTNQKHGHTSDKIYITDNNELALRKRGKCNKDFPTSLSEDKHMESHFGNDFLLCFICGRAFIKKEEYLLHSTLHSVKEKKNSDKPSGNNRNNKSKEIQKNISDGISNNNSHLSNEKKTAEKKKPRKILAIAIRGLRQRHTLVKHLFLHTGKKPFECHNCQKKFAEKRNLEVHMKIHTGERPYKCSICLKAFAQKGYVKIHIDMIHLKKRNFQCFLCLKYHMTRQCLSKHLETHKDEKAFKCTICSKTFKQRDNLRKHLVTHDEAGKRAQCEVCSKMVVDLSTHMKTHTERLRNLIHVISAPKGFPIRHL
ncbi:hypothetical protein JTB14_015389 [Gonioctena quinquepunctata]|nr:hypothetical protein JTB14_015389 [Gonioctena quinquepunctata]